MKKKRDKHENYVDNLESRLLNNPKYDIVQRDIKYDRRGYVGQVDLLTYSKKLDVWYFWEVKSSYMIKSRKKAKEQYQRYCKAHPKKNIRGILYTPSRVRRLYR